MGSRRQRRRVAGWLGLVALAIQALVPLLVAGEISLAAASGDRAVFDLCALGHVHETAPGKTDRHDEDSGALCPICLALHASPVFTTPPVAALPVPAFQALSLAAPEPPQTPRLVTLAAYRSRAPPIG